MSNKELKHEITDEVIKAAKENPDGWVYKIEGEFGPQDPIPPEAIVGAWKVDKEGMLTGEFLENPNYKSTDRNIMLCPRCEQGDIVSATIKKTSKTIFLCEECEATWFYATEIESKEFIDFGSYMESINLSPTWDELENIFRIS